MKLTEWLNVLAFYTDLRLIDLLTVFELQELKDYYDSEVTPFEAYEDLIEDLVEAGYPQTTYLRLAK